MSEVGDAQVFRVISAARSMSNLFSLASSASRPRSLNYGNKWNSIFKRNVSNCLNTNICSYLRDIWGVKVLIHIKILFIFSTPELIRNLWQFKTAVSLHWCAMTVCLTPINQNNLFKSNCTRITYP
jgi:hypothetical protein